MNAEHKHKTKKSKIVHIDEMDKGVEEFYKVVREEIEPQPRVQVPYGISPLIKGYPVREIVDLDGKPLKPENRMD